MKLNYYLKDYEIILNYHFRPTIIYRIITLYLNPPTARIFKIICINLQTRDLDGFK
jgi:hypothetical protein